jgi:DNA-binding MarR family transcriptional regulator
MSLRREGIECKVGLRYLGKILGISKSAVGRAIKELVKAGHLEVVEGGNGQRKRYRFTSPAFLRRCVGCKRYTEQLRPSGLCWVCEEREAG